jgi:hypothetical protein
MWEDTDVLDGIEVDAWDAHGFFDESQFGTVNKDDVIDSDSDSIYDFWDKPIKILKSPWDLLGKRKYRERLVCKE